MSVRYRLTKIRITHSIFIYEILFMHDVTAKGRRFAANGRLLFLYGRKIFEERINMLEAFIKDMGLTLDWQMLVVYALLFSPALIPGILFVHSFRKEPRQFRNALYLLATVLWLVLLLLLRFGQMWTVYVVIVLFALFPVVTCTFLTVNSIIVIRNNGFSLTSLLPMALALFIFLMYCTPIYASQDGLFLGILPLFFFEGLWFSFTFVALLFYSWLYRILPRHRRYDYIIIHGAGLDGEKPTPLLAGRIDRALELWKRQDCRGKFVASGGQGDDEVVTEAQAMRDYLVEHGVSQEVILMEDRSRTTWENLKYSQMLMNADAQYQDYTAAMVTSDFHVFRCAEYAHNLGLKADGVGSHTGGWYWPTAFIREFAAITKAHFWPYVVIAALWFTPIFFQLVSCA